jgi:EAL domain-containing protein (putative c-di-GMP-specific phosphodiesterase class I)
MAPGGFIDLLEDSGLIDRVGLWAIETACRALRGWRAAGHPIESVAVNVSTRQLRDDDFARRALEIVRRNGLQPADLELEITESVFIGNAEATIGQLHTLRAAGVALSLDDFGTGYSSLSYLHRLPITCVKVDRSFVAALGQRDSALALTRTIVALAGALDLQVVAEGVETEQQAALLRKLGCGKLQGFLFSKPLSAQDFAVYCARAAVDEAV